MLTDMLLAFTELTSISFAQTVLFAVLERSHIVLDCTLLHFMFNIAPVK